jgi:hypothetical protein
MIPVLPIDAYSSAVQVDLMLLKNVKWVDGWKDLVLPRGHKEMVQALVETHARGSRSTTGETTDKVEVDLVRGKGECSRCELHDKTDKQIKARAASFCFMEFQGLERRLQQVRDCLLQRVQWLNLICRMRCCIYTEAAVSNNLRYHQQT